MPRIPEAIVEQVLASTDIVEVIGRSVKLRRTGGNFVGLCPFHNEKSPSFNVSPSRHSYHCFGCGAGGTAIRFVMDHDGLTFVEAVKKLADAAGIRIEEEVWDANAEREAKQRSALMKVHAKIAAWFHSLLLKDPCADAARQYLKSRGINSAVAKGWQLGYAPGSNDALRQWAQKQGFSEDLLITAGIMAKGERGETYPRFRQRLMFPICNDNGEVIAFSGRLLEANAKAAKYLNSPETPLFNKSRVLFGFHRSKRAISKSAQAIVCEGQIDMIMAFEAGFENVVAPLGTAFTEHHGKMLKRQADEVVLCYDSDAAGFKAAQRAFQVLAPTGLMVKVAVLPPGDDPDSLIRREGAEVFARLIENALEFIEYQIAHTAEQPKFHEMRERVRFAEQMVANIQLLSSPVARSTALQRVAVRLEVPEEDLRRQLTRGQSSFGKQKPTEPDAESAQSEAAKLVKSQDRNAIMLCRLAMEEPEILDWLRGTGKAVLLEDVPGTELLSLLLQARFKAGDSASMSAFLAGLDPLHEQALIRLQTVPLPPGGLAEAKQALHALELARLQQLIRRTQTQMKTPGLSAEKTAELQATLLFQRKEYLDRRAVVLNSP